ncbi:hypothetical protein HF086_007231 [Spodoptera exigua]|uniref:Protein kinase domain-containing protein n=1 Tax=Spodoptera exigua TaxID=7107 RepID=A0A922MT35_SPOEX|nr:hypothetical protein HF086_007231 [Spodoptera exigua]
MYSVKGYENYGGRTLRSANSGLMLQVTARGGAMAAGSEFVEGWLVAQVLGEGAYGEVRLLVHARSGAAVALKVARGPAADPNAGQAGAGQAEAGQAPPAREAALHRALRHPHVLRCLGERTHQGLHYLFLEYAPGGELFDRIGEARVCRRTRARGRGAL